MKKYYVFTAFMLAVATLLCGQAPQSFNYQAIARDAQGNLLSGKSLTVRIGILQGETLVWQEDHSVQTGDLGLFQLKIGDPNATNQTGTAASFAEIPWGDGNLQMQVSIDDGNGFNLLGTSEFQSVPYALYAMDGPGGSGTPGSAVWSKEADTLSTMNYVGIGTSNPNRSTFAVQGLDIEPETPLFEVRREDGFPVFAVYNDGVMVYVDENSKGRKGGFAVGGYRKGTKGLQQEYLSVTPDSVRVYIPEEPVAKGVKGGFAVGRYTKGAKAGIGQDLLFINSDSTRVYVPNQGNDTPEFQGLQGGFAVTGYSPDAKAPNEYLMGINRGITRFNTADNDQGFAIGSQGEGWGAKYLELTPTNSFIGNDAGLKNMPIDPVDPDEWGLSSMNVFVGYQAGMENLYGHHNTFLGFCAGTKTVGDNTDPDAAAHNVFIGTQAGFLNTQGSYNVNMGCYAGFNNLTGNQNVLIGGYAGYTSQDMSGATMIGNNAGVFYDGPGDVTFLGYYTGNNSTGNNNTFLGTMAGSESGAGTENIFVGRQAGQYAAGDHNVVIGNEAGRGFAGTTDYTGSVLIGFQAGSDLDDNGNLNTMVGYMAGQGATGSGCVFLGANAGTGESQNQQLYIDNSDTYFPLIYGDFFNDWLAVYGDLSVYGTVYADAYDYNAKSDMKGLENPLEKVLSLNGVSYTSTGSPDTKGGEPVVKKHIGVVAQEVEEAFPELVTQRRNGEKTVNYTGLIPVLLEAMKQQQSQIEALQQEIEQLKQQ